MRSGRGEPRIAWAALYALLPRKSLRQSSSWSSTSNTRAAERNALPGTVARCVRNSFHLVEPRHCVAHVVGVDERLLAFVRERERVVGELVHLVRAHLSRTPRSATTAVPGGLPGSRLVEVPTGRCLLSFGSHGHSDSPSVPAKSVTGVEAPLHLCSITPLGAGVMDTF